MSASSLSPDGDGHHAGPAIALSFAAADLRHEGGTVRFAPAGRFADLARRNPSLWLIGERDGRRFAFGPVPDGGRRLFAVYAGNLDTGKFHVPDLAHPVSDSVIRQRRTGAGIVLIAAGGVNPATLTLADSFLYFMREGLFPLLVLGGVGLAAMAFTLFLLWNSLKRVAADAASIRPERPNRRIEERKVPHELLPLVRGFNAALDRLSGELARRKRFIADVAHELRTPLAIASLQVDSLKDGGERRALQRVVTRMSHLVAQMVDVERLSLAGQQRTEIDLVALASDVIADMAPMAMEAGYELSLQAPPHPVAVAGDLHALNRALANLIGNAVAHGGGAGQIQIVVGAWRTIDVIDEGPGVPEPLRANLFEPFARERWDRDGCGLGLHLTREIMRAHGGEVVLLASMHGAAFRLEFA
ncbi:MAG TPA: HAMP domain-containing sensor histidine kinase [Allosphingosinicella sp.]|nr:HAMP domain-containing sensor histidine kinase [Allosphingosinicella sp.]